MKLSGEHVAAGFRLGTILCEPNTRASGVLVAADGSHGYACTLDPGRRAQHVISNHLNCRLLTNAGFPAIEESPGLSLNEIKRPDCLTFIAWHSRVRIKPDMGPPHNDKHLSCFIPTSNFSYSWCSCWACSCSKEKRNTAHTSQHIILLLWPEDPVTSSTS